MRWPASCPNGFRRPKIILLRNLRILLLDSIFTRRQLVVLEWNSRFFQTCMGCYAFNFSWLRSLWQIAFITSVNLKFSCNFSCPILYNFCISELVIESLSSISSKLISLTWRKWYILINLMTSITIHGITTENTASAVLIRSCHRSCMIVLTAPILNKCFCWLWTTGIRICLHLVAQTATV